jgi:hypothetical protein
MKLSSLSNQKTKNMSKCVVGRADGSIDLQATYAMLAENSDVSRTQQLDHFMPGIYMRELSAPAGSLLLGKYHKEEHTVILLKGKLQIIQHDGSRKTLVAPTILKGLPGCKLVYVVEDMTLMNLHATEETDVETIESHLIDNTMLQLCNSKETVWLG